MSNYEEFTSALAKEYNLDLKIFDDHQICKDYVNLNRNSVPIKTIIIEINVYFQRFRRVENDNWRGIELYVTPKRIKEIFAFVGHKLDKESSVLRYTDSEVIIVDKSGLSYIVGINDSSKSILSIIRKF